MNGLVQYSQTRCQTNLESGVLLYEPALTPWLAPRDGGLSGSRLRIFTRPTASILLAHAYKFVENLNMQLQKPLAGWTRFFSYLVLRRQIANTIFRVGGSAPGSSPGSCQCMIAREAEGCVVAVVGLHFCRLCTSILGGMLS